jgi:hypothetical protein
MANAMSLLLDCELFQYHHDRMIGIIMTDAQEVSDGVASLLCYPTESCRIPIPTICTSYTTSSCTMAIVIPACFDLIESGANSSPPSARYSASTLTR